MPETPATRTSTTKAALRVLVVDDDPDAASSMALLLMLDGHDVRQCGSGRQALLDVAAFAPHAVLLDIGLPDLSGHEVAGLLRATPAGAALLLIAVTGWQDSEGRSRHAGFDHHLTKPVNPHRLSQLLAAVTPG